MTTRSVQGAPIHAGHHMRGERRGCPQRKRQQVAATSSPSAHTACCASASVDAPQPVDQHVRSLPHAARCPTASASQACMPSCSTPSPSPVRPRPMFSKSSAGAAPGYAPPGQPYAASGALTVALGLAPCSWPSVVSSRVCAAPASHHSRAGQQYSGGSLCKPEVVPASSASIPP